MPQKLVPVGGVVPDDQQVPIGGEVPDMGATSVGAAPPGRGKHPSARLGEAVVDFLPAIGGGIGGVLGAGAGGIGAVPGAVIGAAGGEAWRQNLGRMMGKESPETMTEAATDIGVQGIVGGLSEGVGQGLVAGAKALAPRLMQSALKPGVKAILSDVRKGVPVPRVVQTLLDEGISVTKGGVAKLNDILNRTNAEIRAAVSGSQGHVFPEAVAARTGTTMTQFGPTQQLNPKLDLAAIRNSVDEFLDVRSGGQYPAKPLSPLEAHDLKIGEYKHLSDKAYSGDLKGAEIEARKAMARGLKEDTASTVKASSGVDIDKLNRKEGSIIEAGEEVARRVAQSGNRDLAGFAWATGGPLGGPAGAANWLLALMDRSPAVKSLIARGLWGPASSVAKTSPHLLRAAVAAITSAKDDEVR